MQLTYLLTPLFISLGINIALFLVAYRFKTDKLTDGAYALSFAVIAAVALLTGELTGARVLITSLVLLWALRLGAFLVYRIWKTGKDQRFDAWRNNFWLLGRFWVLQAITAWVVMLPALFVLSHNDISLTRLSYIGLAIWAGGLSIEAVADIQKYNFNAQSKNKGKWIAQGLWSWSRHPNYFGEISVWTGTYLVAFASMTGLERLIGLISPLFIAGLLLFVSGIPILEKQADERWGKDANYQAYKRATSILIPRPPTR